MSSATNPNLKVASGRVSKVDQDGKSITVDQSSGTGALTLSVDERTQILDSTGSYTSSSISSLQEGYQVRASFDPASNHADKIEVTSKGAKKSYDTTMPSTTSPSTTTPPAPSPTIPPEPK
jgi:hypothetical protein